MRCRLSIIKLIAIILISAECNVDDVNIDLNMLLVVKISYHNNEDVFDKLHQPDN